MCIPIFTIHFIFVIYTAHRRSKPHSRHPQQNLLHPLRRSRPPLLQRLDLQRPHAKSSRLPPSHRRLDAPPRLTGPVDRIRSRLLKRRPPMPQPRLPARDRSSRFARARHQPSVPSERDNLLRARTPLATRRSCFPADGGEFWTGVFFAAGGV
jgi:hypothetical protein